MNKNFFASRLNKGEAKKKKQKEMDDFETDSFNTHSMEELNDEEDIEDAEELEDIEDVYDVEDDEDDIKIDVVTDEESDEDSDNDEFSFELKPKINEYNAKNFDWHKYVKHYPDLYKLNTKEKAWNHWINHGKDENRIFFMNKIKEMNMEIKTEVPRNFDWRSYIKCYPDLSKLTTKEKAWNHWINHGKKEKRTYFTLTNENHNMDDNYEKFEWKTYIKNYEDLKKINTKMEAWNHWINHGKKEKRVTYDLDKKELDNYEEIKKKENQLLKKGEKKDFFFSKNNVDNKKRLIFKNIYDSYGTHYYGWKGVINQFVSYFQEVIFNCKENIFFDEWIEKLLLWGNKFQSKEYIDIIKSQNCKLVTFLHNPPCLKFEDKEYKKNIDKCLIMNDEQMNKNILSKLDIELNKNLKFIYLLSVDHKKNIYHNYPELKDKVTSVYHPIDMKMNEFEKEFDFDLFKNNRKIFHIGWWLRNFKTFIDFIPPEKFKKNILVKNDFKSQWNDHILKHHKVKNINVIHELSNEEYLKIFENSCIFIDFEDAVASNIILECLKFNTPFITRYNKSIEEYVGCDYPLYFDNVSELELLMDEDIFYTAIKDANEYLRNLDKSHIELSSFNKKITYDLDKLKLKTFKYKLSWICILTEEFSSKTIINLIHNFIRQENQENLQLAFITHSSWNVNKLSEKLFSEYDNIYLFTIDDPNEFIKNLDTEYILLVNLNDKYKTSYSKFCIEYLDSKQNADVIFSSFKDMSRILKEEEDNKVNKYKEGMYFFDDIENGMLPSSGFVFRKTIDILFGFDFLFMEKKDMYKYFLRNHLNIVCISEKPLFITC